MRKNVYSCIIMTIEGCQVCSDSSTKSLYTRIDAPESGSTPEAVPWKEYKLAAMANIVDVTWRIKKKKSNAIRWTFNGLFASRLLADCSRRLLIQRGNYVSFLERMEHMRKCHAFLFLFVTSTNLQPCLQPRRRQNGSFSLAGCANYVSEVETRGEVELSGGPY